MSTPSGLARDLIDALDRGESRPALRLRAAALVAAELTRLMRAEGPAYIPTPARRAARPAAMDAETA